MPVSEDIDWASAWRTDGERRNATRPATRRAPGEDDLWASVPGSDTIDITTGDITTGGRRTGDVTDGTDELDLVDDSGRGGTLDLGGDDDLWGRVIERAGLNRPRTPEETD